MTSVLDQCEELREHDARIAAVEREYHGLIELPPAATEEEAQLRALRARDLASQREELRDERSAIIKRNAAFLLGRVADEREKILNDLAPAQQQLDAAFGHLVELQDAATTIEGKTGRHSREEPLTIERVLALVRSRAETRAVDERTSGPAGEPAPKRKLVARVLNF